MFSHKWQKAKKCFSSKTQITRAFLKLDLLNMTKHIGPREIGEKRVLGVVIPWKSYEEGEGEFLRE